MRRRSHTRRVPQDCIINMAEARREIVQALQLHRSSMKQTSTTKSTGIVAAASIPKVASSSQCCYYSLTESMPLPEPVWSTTAPTISAAPPAAMESLEFEWGENQASSYSWWLGFLKTLDGKIVEHSKYQHLEKINNAMENSRVGFGHQDSSKLGDGDGSDQNSSPDEWLMFPSYDDQGETTNPL
ncbi:hypothetical protein Patl1_31473 [Pistacia atlantica]|uniref:Uncharacterized protein n=1 Tax=Pistacia atlantica TaxID=434234 RepID=A0ACC1APD2_9ROSI|nr:hypothetical protein Patl1_31473 [Pistacia atlantica]